MNAKERDIAELEMEGKKTMITIRHAGVTYENDSCGRVVSLKQLEL